MKIVELRIAELKEYENNPRLNDKAVESVAESIMQFGFKVPIIVDCDNVIVAGHTRLKAARFLGMECVPCIVADDLTDDQIKAFRLADNKVSEFAEWDFSMLEKELEEIDMNMSVFGFDIDVDFEIGGETEQGDLTQKETETMCCPHCGEVIEL